MDIEVSLPLEEALDLGWRTLAECFRPEQLLMKQELIDKYYPKDAQANVQVASAEEAEETGQTKTEKETTGGTAAA